MTKLEVLNLVGKETTVKFNSLIDGIVSYQTLVPFIEDGFLSCYELSFFYNADVAILEFDELGDINLELFELNVININDEKASTLYPSKSSN